jgi:filamin
MAFDQGSSRNDCHLCFEVELKEAGEGTLEISINGPSGQNIPNNVVSLGPAQFEVCYTPIESGQHRANINFNKENVTGMLMHRILLNHK